MHLPATDKYESLQTQLINLHSESKESKIRQLFQGQEFSDQQTPQLISRMWSLTENSVDEPLQKSLWLSCLSTNTQGILTTMSGDLPNLVTIADKITDLVNPSQSINPVTFQNYHVSVLEKQISQLSK